MPSFPRLGNADTGNGEVAQTGFNMYEDLFRGLFASKGGLFPMTKKRMAVLGDQVTLNGAWPTIVANNLDMNEGVVSTATVAAGGTGYVNGETLTIVQRSSGGNCTVTATVVGGAVTSVAIANGGTLYCTANNLAVTGGSGSGCILNITALVSTVRREEINGGTWVGSTSPSIYTQVASLKTFTDANPTKKPDVIILFAGGNDSNTPANWYTSDFATAIATAYASLDRTKMCEAIRYNLITLMTNYPNAVIYVVLPIIRTDHTFAQTSAKAVAIKQMAQYMNAQIIDATLESGITLTIENDTDTYLDSGGIVPTSAGQSLLGQFITNKVLEKYFPKA